MFNAGINWDFTFIKPSICTVLHCKSSVHVFKNKKKNKDESLIDGKYIHSF